MTNTAIPSHAELILPAPAKLNLIRRQPLREQSSLLQVSRTQP